MTYFTTLAHRSGGSGDVSGESDDAVPSVVLNRQVFESVGVNR